jgi:DNA-binding MarR family transcriptional regulator
MMRAPAVTTSMTDAGASTVQTPAIATPEPGQLNDTSPLPHGQTASEQERELEQAGEIGSIMIQLVRLYGSIRARVTAGPDGEPSPLFLLLKLAHLGPSRASDLAENLCADPSTISRQVSSLVKSGLIERRADPDDGRASILAPTELGAQRVREQEQRRGYTVLPVLEDWPVDDRENLLRLLRKYTDGVEERRDEIVSIMLRATDSPRHHDGPAHRADHHRKEGH